MRSSARQFAFIEAAGQMAAIGDRIARLETRLAAAPHWQPGLALQRQCEEARRLLTGIEARLERRLVVTLVGPSGSGKSTLLNALAGVDHLSPVGLRRPTTREVVLFGQAAGDARPLAEALGGAKLRTVTSPAAEALSDVLLVDTPDVDSVEGRSQQALVERIIDLSDVLLCVFDAENPKRRDQIDFLAPLVRRFDGEALVALLNKCDRQALEELRQVIVPDFRQHLASAWGEPPPVLLCVAGRAALAEPSWDPSALPRHDFNEFDRLREMVFGTLNAPGQRVDRRLANAVRIHDFVSGRIAQEASRDRAALSAALDMLEAAAADARKNAISVIGEAREELSEAHQWLYHHLTRHWLGPVGWLIATWNRLLTLGTHLTALRHPLRGLKSLGSPSGPAETTGQGGSSPRRKAPGSTAMAEATAASRAALLRHWPDLSEALVKARFDPSLRHPATAQPMEEIGAVMADRWSGALREAVERKAHALSHPLLQLALNLPVLGLLAYVAWVTLRDFVSAAYRPAAFFLHALIAVATALLLSFFLFQIMARLTASPDRLARSAMERLNREGQDGPPEGENPLSSEIATVLALCEKPSPEP